MSIKCSAKIVFKDQPSPVVLKDDLMKYDNYNKLKDKILEKSANKSFTKVKLTQKDKFILEIEEYDSAGMTSIWSTETYSYFLDKLQKNPPEKLKLNIVKVNEYPIWNQPKYGKILKEALNSAWNLTKKEIKEDLTEKYLDEGKRFFNQEKRENDPKLIEELYMGLHSNVVCNNCLTSNFSGARYICAECDNFNLCEYCQKNARVSHTAEHTFIKLNSPVLVEIQKYNSIFSPKNQLINTKEEPFEIKIDIVNTGEKNLQGCFISPIRFGNKYLGCLKKTILEECNKGEKISMDIFVKFEDEDDEDESLNTYEGYFRLMTQEGIPFGDIFNIKVLIEE